MSWKGGCHCGAVTVELAGAPDMLSECNCSLCFSHGTLWAYVPPRDVRIEGETRRYVRADRESPNAYLHFCPHCGCTTHWSPTPGLIARIGDVQHIGVNMRLFDPARLSGLPLLYPDGRHWDGQSQWGFARPAGVMP